jgi:coatomer protein complex subunit alpha (xenin)
MSSERNADLRVKAIKVLQKSEQMARNEHTLNYGETKTVTIGCHNFASIYFVDESIECLLRLDLRRHIDGSQTLPHLPVLRH